MAKMQIFSRARVQALDILRDVVGTICHFFF
jgi:hypothetical protein